MNFWSPGLLLLLGRDDPDLLHPLELAAVVLHRVGQALDPGGELQLDGGIPGPGFLHDVDLPAVPVRDVRHPEILFVGQVARGVMPVGPSGVAEEEHEVSLLDPCRLDAQVPLRLERDVLRGEIGGRAVGRDIGAEEGEIARVAGPHPVVDLAAEVADGDRGDEDEPDVLEERIEEEDVTFPDEHLRDLGPLPRVGLLGRGDDLFHLLLDGLRPVGEREAGPDGGEDLGRDVLERLRDPGGHAGSADLLGPGLGQESMGQVVFLGSAGRLDGAEGDMVVGQEEAVGRDERACGADADDGEDEARPVGREDLLGGDGQALRAKIELQDLAHREHAFVGRKPGGRRGEDEKGEDEGCGDEAATRHGTSLFLVTVISIHSIQSSPDEEKLSVLR